MAQGVAGFILPGNRVDVLLSLGEISGTHETGGGSTITLHQNVEILAVDQKMDAPSDNKVDTKDLRSVTLLVTPQQANLLDLGQNKGMLHLCAPQPSRQRGRPDQAGDPERPAAAAAAQGPGAASQGLAYPPRNPRGCRLDPETLTSPTKLNARSF